MVLTMVGASAVMRADWTAELSAAKTAACSAVLTAEYLVSRKAGSSVAKMAALSAEQWAVCWVAYLAEQ